MPRASCADAAVDLRAVAVVRGSVPALAGVDLRVGAGERVAVIGPSGAGKSTLLGVLNATVAPSSGTASVLGCRFGDAPPRRVRRVQRRIGTVHQRFDLVEQLGVVHNVNAGRLGSWPLWKSVASLAFPRGLPEVLDALDRVGIGGTARRQTGDLSGGEQQRVAIARVLVQRPELVLADEPVASLDPVRGREVVDLLLALSDELGSTLITCLHDVDLALGSFDRVIGLRHGAVVFDRPPHEVHRDDVGELYAVTAPYSAP